MQISPQITTINFTTVHQKQLLKKRHSHHTRDFRHIQRSEERFTELTVMSSNKQLMATKYKYSNNNNKK